MSRYGRKRISRRDMLKAAGALVGTMAVLGGGAYLLQRLDDEKRDPRRKLHHQRPPHRGRAEGSDLER